MKTKHILLTTLFTGLILVSSCGPKPKNAVAPSNDLLQQVRGVQTLEDMKDQNYEPIAGTFAFFLWPKEEDLTEIQANTGLNTVNEVVAAVAEESTRMDKWFNSISEDKYNLAELETQKKSIKMERNQSILKDYACYETANGCLKDPNEFPNDDANKIRVPLDCPSIVGKPWYRHGRERVECNKRIKEFEKGFEDYFIETHSDLHKKLEQLNSTMLSPEEETDKLNSFLDPIMNSVDPRPHSELHYTNWIKTESTESKIMHGDGIKKPELIELKFKINNLKSDEYNEKNKALVYTSKGDNPDIKNINLVLEKNTPTLKFRIDEKRYLPENEDASLVDNSIPTSAPTGNYFEVELRRSQQKFGLLYVGKVKKFNVNNVQIADGMLKLIFRKM